jgi:glucosyl-dolichyl phosphate glucuronosyltransferase
MDQIDITVAVCTYNRKQLLLETLESLVKQKTDGAFTFEILVVDDGSSDGTREAVLEFVEQCPLSCRRVDGGGQGVGHARNTAIESSIGEWIAFIDDDEIADEEWLYELYAVTSKPDVFIVGGPYYLRLPDEQVAGMSEVTQLVIGGFRFPFDTPHPFPESESPGTGNCLIKRSVFDKIGMFSTSSSAGEDSDLWGRAGDAGYRYWYSPKAIIRHYVPPYRLEEKYLKWNSMRWGSNKAQRNWEYRGMLVTLLLWVARLGNTIIINLPMLGKAMLVGDKGDALTRKCAIWRAYAYSRRCMLNFSGGLLQQKRFFDYIDFRNERKSLGLDKDGS